MVGIVANPASGRDIRRLVAGASVFGNPEKAGMVYRVLVGLAAAGVDKALMMPAADGLGWTLERLMKAHGRPLPLEILDMPITGTAQDTITAVERMREATAIVVLGGDGTHRVVAKACGDTPIVALSTGTNNAFPEMREATIAGLAAGLFTDQLIREPALKVGDDLALVDVAVSNRPFAGAKALWRADSITELFVTKPNPAAVGLSAIAGQLASGPVHVTLGRAGTGIRVHAAIAPGLVVPVDVAKVEPLNGPVTVHEAGCLALDGEREIERPGATTISLTQGPNRVDIDAVMRATRLQPPQE